MIFKLFKTQRRSGILCILDSIIFTNKHHFIFAGEAVSGVGLDLVSLNIQRGRDHGIQKYTKLRDSLGLDRRVRDFSDITSSNEFQDKLARAYGNNVDEVDAWIGGLGKFLMDANSTSWFSSSSD